MPRWICRRRLLEGQGLDMKVGILNLRDPALRIDAMVQRLDLQALKFIRLPWSPKTPATSPAAERADTSRCAPGISRPLPLSNLKTDFERNGGDWRVYNLHGVSLGGKVDLEITGRQKDDWIRIKGRVAGMDAAGPDDGRGPGASRPARQNLRQLRFVGRHR